MNIAIITSGMLPVPAVQGGAVENLLDYLLKYNDQHHLHTITIYSVYHNKVKNNPALQSKVNHYIYIKTHSVLFKIGAKIYSKWTHKSFYYYQIDYFLECIIKKMKRSSYDLIISENRPGFAIRLSESFNTPIITHIHTNLLNIPSEKNIKAIADTKGFIVVSDYIKREIRSINKTTNIRVVYNGLDSNIFNPKTTIPIDRGLLGLQKNDFVVIYWGRLVPAKGIKELILALQMLKEYSDIKLLVIGSINYEDTKDQTNSFYKELLSIANSLDNKIKFTGYISYNDIPKYLSIANVAVIPSQINEAFGMTCIEACAMGLPIIATNDGGIPETLIGQKHILIEKDGNIPNMVKNAIMEIKNNYSLYKGNSLSPQFYKDAFSKSFFDCISDFIK